MGTWQCVWEEVCGEEMSLLLLLSSSLSSKALQFGQQDPALELKFFCSIPWAAQVLWLIHLWAALVMAV